ncbi:MAG: lactoylglutathione lyase [Planctomycetota bacterium]|jgi:lactoylglutathione lyase
MNTITSIATASALAIVTTFTGLQSPATTPATAEAVMPLGNFSISLAVKDIKVSKAFYEKLDFKEVGGDLRQKWIILQNGTTTIGLFQGMFEKNIMTFNPGWNKDKETPNDFKDIREIQTTLKERGIKLITEADMTSKGPDNFVLADPDGNQILFDQHVARPEK